MSTSCSLGASGARLKSMNVHLQSLVRYCCRWRIIAAERHATSATRCAFRVLDVRPGIANEHVSIWHLDCCKRLGIKRRIRRQQAVEAEDIGGHRVDVVVAE